MWKEGIKRRSVLNDDINKKIINKQNNYERKGKKEAAQNG
jgi:hypothetical protein